MAEGGRQELDLVTEVRQAVARTPAGHVAILCVGASSHGDDGFGPSVARRLAGRLPSPVFDCGTTPENDLPRVASLGPRVVLFVDAVHFGGRPGELRLLAGDSLAHRSFSTHAASLAVAAQFLRESCQARVLVLAAQPARVDPGSPMSPEVQRAATQAANALVDALAPPCQ